MSTSEILLHTIELTSYYFRKAMEVVGYPARTKCRGRFIYDDRGFNSQSFPAYFPNV